MKFINVFAGPRSSQYQQHNLAQEAAKDLGLKPDEYQVRRFNKIDIEKGDEYWTFEDEE